MSILNCFQAQGNLCISTSPVVTPLQVKLRFHLQHKHNEFIFLNRYSEEEINCPKVIFSGDGCGTRSQSLLLYSFANKCLFWLVVKLEKENVKITVG